MTGDVRLKLFTATRQWLNRSPHSLYEKIATFKLTRFNQRDAEGFIKLNALRLSLEVDVNRDRAYPNFTVIKLYLQHYRGQQMTHSANIKVIDVDKIGSVASPPSSRKP